MSHPHVSISQEAPCGVLCHAWEHNLGFMRGRQKWYQLSHISVHKMIFYLGQKNQNGPQVYFYFLKTNCKGSHPPFSGAVEIITKTQMKKQKPCRVAVNCDLTGLCLRWSGVEYSFARWHRRTFLDVILPPCSGMWCTF